MKDHTSDKKNVRLVRDTRIKGYSNTSSPIWLWEVLPRTEKSQKTVLESRRYVENLMDMKETRKLFIVGPCSVHSYFEMVEYAQKLKLLSKKVKDKIVIFLRVNIEKPRTLADWPGFLEDPDRDGTNHIEKGRYFSRKLLKEITEMGLPCATEYVNTSTPQYIGDFISWTWIGARTVESQMHKRMASGLSTPVGFKNASGGDILPAVNGVLTAMSPSRFPGINPDGKEAVISAAGNPYGCVVLRGGKQPNYEASFVRDCEQIMKKKGVRPRIIVDCSHGNSLKDHNRQADVLRDVVSQMKTNQNLTGLMLESYLFPGRQKDDGAHIKKGISVTDACVGFDMTEKLVTEAWEML